MGTVLVLDGVGDFHDHPKTCPKKRGQAANVVGDIPSIGIMATFLGIY